MKDVALEPELFAAAMRLCDRLQGLDPAVVKMMFEEADKACKAWTPADAPPAHHHAVLVAICTDGKSAVHVGHHSRGKWKVQGCGKVTVTHWMEKPPPPPPPIQGGSRV